MDRVIVDIKGQKELLARLVQRGKKVKKVLKAAATAGAKVMERGQRRRVRVRQTRPSGRVSLKSTIKARTVTFRGTFVVMNTGPGKGGKHANPLQSGHVMSGRFQHLAPARVKPFPFTGFEEDKKGAFEALKAHLLRAATK